MQFCPSVRKQIPEKDTLKKMTNNAEQNVARAIAMRVLSKEARASGDGGLPTCRFCESGRIDVGRKKADRCVWDGEIRTYRT
jgi:hypothetical protein